MTFYNKKDLKKCQCKKVLFTIMIIRNNGIYCEDVVKNYPDSVSQYDT